MQTVNRTARDDHEFQARLLVVENEVGQIKSLIKDLSTTVREAIHEQHKAPRAIPFKEIIVSASASFALCVGLLNFMASQNELANRDIRRDIAAHAKQLERLAPLTYAPQLR